MATVNVDLIANINKAVKNVQNFSSQATKAVSSVTDSFFSLRNVALSALAGIGIGKFVKDAVAAAAEQEQAVQKLNTALALTGELSEENTKGFLDFASALQANSTVGDEVSLGLVALAKSFGASNEQAKLILQTAADLSAVTGESLESSVRNLSKTLGGLKGELGETQPALRNLTKEQLENGEGIRILSKQYEGAAKALTKTFSGALTQTSNSFGDLLEEIGFFITQNPAVIAAINLASELFNDLGKSLASNRESFVGLVRDGLLVFTDTIPFLIRLTGNFIVGLQSLKATLDIIQLGLASTALKAAQAFDFILKSASILVSGAFLPVLNAIEGVAKGLELIGLETNASRFETFSKNVTDSIFDVGTSLEGVVDKLTEFRDESRVTLGESTEKIADTVVTFENAALRADTFSTRLMILTEEAEQSDEALKNLSKANQDVGESASLATKQMENLFMGSVRTGFGEGSVDLSVVPTVDFSEIAKTDPIQINVAPDLTSENLENTISVLLDPENILPDSNSQEAIEKAAKQQEEAALAQALLARQEAEDRKEFISDLGSVSSSILSGAEGARKLLVDGGALIADAVVPGLGAAIGPLINALSQGPEFVRQQVEEFANALPILIEAIAESIPVLIEVVAANADKIAIALARATPLIATALARALVEKIDEAFGTDFSIQFDESITRWETATQDLQTKYLTSVEDGTRRILGNFQSGLNQFTSTGERFVNAAVNGIKTAAAQASEAFLISANVFTDQVNAAGVALNEALLKPFERIELIVNQIGAVGSEIGSSWLASFEFFLGELFAFEFPSLPELVATIPELPKFELGFDVSTISNAITAPFDPIIKFFENFKIQLPDLPGSGGSGGGFVGQVTRAFGFASGGRVPAGFPNDSFPARLTSNEEVLDTSTSQQLRDFLADQGGEQNVQINLQIGEKQLADVLVNLNRQGFRLAP